MVIKAEEKTVDFIYVYFLYIRVTKRSGQSRVSTQMIKNKDNDTGV